MNIHDTCGVHNLHGMPAVLSAIASAIYACLATPAAYKSELGVIFPAMLSKQQAEALPNSNNATLHLVLGGYDRTAGAQAGYQIVGIVVTVLVAIVGGVLTGLVLKYAGYRKLDKPEHHQDELYWEVPEQKEEYLERFLHMLEQSSANSSWSIRPFLLRYWTVFVPANNLYIRGAYK